MWLIISTDEAEEEDSEEDTVINNSGSKRKLDSVQTIKDDKPQKKKRSKGKVCVKLTFSDLVRNINLNLIIVIIIGLWVLEWNICVCVYW